MPTRTPGERSEAATSRTSAPGGGADTPRTPADAPGPASGWALSEADRTGSRPAIGVPRRSEGLGLVPTRIPDARTNPAERLAFGLAIVVAPLGLLASVVAAAVSSRRRGWVPGLVVAGIVVGSVLTLALAGAAVVADGVISDTQQDSAARAESQPMCRAIRIGGLDPTGADLGWPTPGDSVDETVASVRAYADRWSAVAALAPEQVRSGVTPIAAAAVEIEARITSSRLIDDAGNSARMRAVRQQSSLPGWVATHCG